MTKLQSKQNKLTSRRAVAPVIATLLLVAIAVVGGSIVFVFSQGFFSSAQISGAPQIESLQINGYDATDVTNLQLHDGSLIDQQTTPNVLSGVANNGLLTGERVAVYVTNQGVAQASLTEVRFAGSVYNYVPGIVGTPLETWDADTLMNATSFTIVNKGVAGQVADLSTSPTATIQPGQQATILLELEQDVQFGRDAQFKLTTANGAVFVGTVVAGQQSG
ncbi:MAG: archaellin/type IV pilin N-terminal domain-containing protein [Nitrosopumilus sp.]